LVFSLRIGDLSQVVYLVELLWFSPSGIGDLTVGRKPKELKKIEKLAKVGNTGGRNP
jgi:hypothetical protein